MYTSWYQLEVRLSKESCITTGDFRDVKADKALAEHYGTVGCQRAVVDGQRGYTVIAPNGVKCFHFRLGDALQQVVRLLGHGDDRDVMIVGEPEKGNCW